jgi:3-oxoacyl-[acyl-carrier protein] reductase
MNRVAIVTGAGRGIGAAIAEQLEAQGFNVVKLDRTKPNKPNEYQFELAAIDTHQVLVSDIMNRYGRIDCLINNAGIASPKRGDFLGLTPETFDTVIDINLRGTVFFSQAVVKAMLTSKSDQRRSIQFITSASAVLASPERLDYCMSKAALSMFAKGLALRLASEGINVFEIRPGIIQTDMTAGVAAKYDALIASGLVPENRWGLPQDIGKICATLAIGALPFATGTIIQAGGGLHIGKL